MKPTYTRRSHLELVTGGRARRLRNKSLMIGLAALAAGLVVFATDKEAAHQQAHHQASMAAMDIWDGVHVRARTEARARAVARRLSPTPSPASENGTVISGSTTNMNNSTTRVTINGKTYFGDDDGNFSYRKNESSTTVRGNTTNRNESRVNIQIKNSQSVSQ